MVPSLPHILSGFVSGLCCNYFPENSLRGLQPAPKFRVVGHSLCDFCPDWHDPLDHDNLQLPKKALSQTNIKGTSRSYHVDVVWGR
jgi:hypothetical protein